MSSGRKEAEVLLSMREHSRLGTLRAVIEGQFTQRDAAQKLRLSTRQVRRLQSRLEAQGPKGFVHANRGRPSIPRLREEKREELVRLYDDTYGAKSFRVGG